jgi:uncharacterized LabA/DUF88 family protein
MFVDVGNQFYYANGRWPGKKINYREYFALARQCGHVSRAYAYGTQIDGSAIKFTTALQHMGFECCWRSIERGKWYSWDVGIAMDAYIFTETDGLDIVILGTSNYTMVHVVRALQGKGVKVIIMACNIPQELREIADSCIEITEEMLEGRHAHSNPA